MIERMKRLYRSRKDRTIFGIFGGLGEYVNVDPVIFRIIWVLVVVFSGIIPGVLVYVLAYFIIPLEPEEVRVVEIEKDEETKNT